MSGFTGTNGQNAQKHVEPACAKEQRTATGYVARQSSQCAMQSTVIVRVVLLFSDLHANWISIPTQSVPILNWI